jgi:large subunit ribosomal protein L7/L12
MSIAPNDPVLRSYVDPMLDRIRALEAQVRLLSEHAGLPFETAATDVPDEVLQLVQAGDRIGAVKRYRELTGAGLEDARTVVLAL